MMNFRKEPGFQDFLYVAHVSTRHKTAFQFVEQTLLLAHLLTMPYVPNLELDVNDFDVTINCPSVYASLHRIDYCFRKQ